MIVLDASVLIAHLDPAHIHHDEATQLLLAAVDDVLLVHPLTMAEVLVGGARIGRAGEMRTDLEAIGIRVADSDADQSLRLGILRATSGLTLPDCCVLDSAIQYRAAMATFDRALARVGATRGITVLP